MRREKLGLYIHIPFCASKCVYCDFLSFPPGRLLGGKTAADWQNLYTGALIKEIRAARENSLRDFMIDTVYIGGGTPTALAAPFLLEIVGEINRFNPADSTEFTVEANPGTLTPELLAALKSSGVNRLSVGLQAWQDELLKKIGRIYSVQMFKDNYAAARAAGFDNINVDIMFSLPGQTMDDWRETLENLAALNPEHISAYSLTPEEDTVLWDNIQSGVYTLPDDETDRAMYAYANTFLAGKGYKRYEISNYARPGYESRHNIKYWKRMPYAGFGLGAHSFIGGARTHNTAELERYIIEETHQSGETAVLSPADAMAEHMFLGLRMAEGVSEEEFFLTFNKTPDEVYGTQISELTGGGLLRRENGRLFLTGLGTDLANRVFVEFV